MVSVFSKHRANPMKKSIVTALFLGCLVAHSAIAAETFQVNPIESFVLFKVNRLGIAYVYGRFTGGLSGTITTDPAAPDKSKVDLEVKTSKFANKILIFSRCPILRAISKPS